MLFRSGLVSLIHTAIAAKNNAVAARLDTTALAVAIESAEAVVKQPVAEEPYALAIRYLRHEIRALDVPEAKLAVLNQFATRRWSAPEEDRVTARGNHPPHQTASEAFDGDPKTKWLDFSPQGSWIQYTYKTPVIVKGYAITSADDGPERDPRDWQLLGSSDGQNWTTLDTRAGEMWTKRFETRSFGCENDQPYRFYRLDISAVRDATTA